MIRITRLYVALWSATLARPAFASYRDGDLGMFLVLLSVPVAAAAFLIAVLLVLFGQFKKDAVFLVYVTVVCVGALFVVVLCAGDPASAGIALLGEAALLVPVLLPAIIQYSRRQRIHPSAGGDAKGGSS